MTAPLSRPDFYLSSTEHRGEWAKPRAGYVEQVTKDRRGVTHLWIRLSPSAENAGVKVRHLVVGPHFEGASVWPDPRFPLPVYLYVLKAKKPPTPDVFEPSDFDLVAWAELYKSRDDAERAAIAHR